MRWNRRLSASGVKLAVFALVCLVLLGGLAVRIGNLSLFPNRRALSAQLSDVTGLTNGDAVKVAGVTVGQVTGISTQRGHALVTFSLDANVRLRSSTAVGVRWRNVIGQKYLYLYPGSTGPYLAGGSTIPLGHEIADADVGALLDALGPFLKAIDPKEVNTFLVALDDSLQGNEVKVRQLIDNAAAVSQTVGSLDVQVGQVIDNLSQVLTAIASRNGDVGQLVSNLQAVSASLASRNDLLDSVVTNLSGASGDLANLLGTNRQNLDGSISSLNQVAAEIAQHKASLSSGLTTLATGLAPYQQISSYGQWFEIQVLYTCLANQLNCTYAEPTNPPGGAGPAPFGSGTGGSPSVADIVRAPAQGRP